MSEQGPRPKPEAPASTGVAAPAHDLHDDSERAVLQELVAIEANRERGRAAKGVVVGVGLSALIWAGLVLAFLL